MAVWRHIDSFASAASELGVEVVGPTTIQIAPELFIAVDMYFPHFGSERGTVVVENFAPIMPYRDVLRAAGFGCSTFSAPSRGFQYSANDLAEMLSEWGWTGPENAKPSWLQAFAKGS